jgi:hypothetical protein
MKSTSDSDSNSLPTPGDTVRQIANVAALAGTLVVNYLANALPINGQTTAQVSDKFPVYFVPAGYVFSIWGIIYLGLLAFTIYQALPSQRANPMMRRIGYLFAASSVVNSLWIFMWHYEQFALTLLLMLALLALLITIYLRLDIGRARVSPLERWIVHIPFSIYLGWITVATIANTTDVLYLTGWDGWGISGEAWAAIMLGAATAITSVIALTRRDLAYSAVIVWAFIGIAVKQADASIVAITAIITAGVVAVVAAAALLLYISRTRTTTLRTAP